MLSKLVALFAVVAVSVALVFVWRFAIFILPFNWTGEADRLASLLRIGPGTTVADVGAGNGALAVEMARRVGEHGLVYATELSADRREAIAERVSRARLANVRIVEARDQATGLPDACCDGLYLRTVLHHVADRPAFARALLRAVKPGGRVAIIDFAPGTLWFHGSDHGVRTEDAVRAHAEAGFTLVQQVENWGGGTYALVFERKDAR
ncbi:MAG: class I SAM-dependent methyltransferase [Vicinamibacterales bacterium]